MSDARILGLPKEGKQNVPSILETLRVHHRRHGNFE